MALQKDVVQADGVTTKYHRILYVTITTNQQNSIAVVSYVNNDARENEKESIIAQPYQKAVTYETEYDPNMDIKSAYQYLKTLSEFENAVDV